MADRKSAANLQEIQTFAERREAKIAYTIDELARMGPIRRSKIYESIATGDLIARKSGRRTFVMASDFEAFLEARPLLEISRDK